MGFYQSKALLGLQTLSKFIKAFFLSEKTRYRMTRLIALLYGGKIELLHNDLPEFKR